LRLTSLCVAANVIEAMDPNNLSKNLPNLTHLDLTHNQITSLFEVSNLGKACSKLEFLSLHGNPVTSKCPLVRSVRILLLGRPACLPSWLTRLDLTCLSRLFGLCLIQIFLRAYSLREITHSTFSEIPQIIANPSSLPFSFVSLLST
jgi:Leucine-rich repeat (LRR) protein